MNMKLPAGRFRIVLSLLGVAVLFGAAWVLFEQGTSAGAKAGSGTLEKLAVASGNVSVEIDTNKLNGVEARPQNTASSFTVGEAMFTIITFDGEMRATLPSAMEIAAETDLPATLEESRSDLVIEAMMPGSPYELVLRNAATGFTFFNIEGHQFDYIPASHSLRIFGGRLLVSDDYAAQLGRPKLSGSTVGTIEMNATMRVLEITQIEGGKAISSTLPPSNTENGTVPGPDVIVGDVYGLQQFGSAVSGHVGLAVGTNSCNKGTENLNWYANPDNDHPVIPQNLYRMSGGTDGTRTFEHIGQSSVKHAFTALTQNLCEFGCNNVGGDQLGSGCSDPYSASLNSGPNLGSRAWINPFNGFYPETSAANNSHGGHSHNSTSHRILTPVADLNTSLNAGAKYYAEGQYVTPHEYQWCQSNPGQCNMYNNVSYKRYTVSGTASFSFSEAASTVREATAITAWPGATIVMVEPAPGVDGRAFIAYKVTNPSAGVWHYEYAIYNQNLDRSIQSFGIPFWPGVSYTSIGFHAPPQHPGSSVDGTVGNTGYSNTPWAQTQAGGFMTWGSESFAQNQNANAVRWGTLYNIRFDSSRPPAIINASVGFLKTGSPVTVQVMAPSSNPGPRFCYDRQPAGERCTPPPAG